MKICVLVKQVPNEDAIIKVSSDGNHVIEDNLTYCTNEPDTYALEEALLIKEQLSDCEVVVCTMGSESTSQILKEALAKGADRAILIDHNSKNIDPLSNAKIIGNILKKENFNLILSGLQSDDSGHSQTGVLLSEILNMTHAALVVGTEIKGDEKIRVKKELESGWFQWSEMELPSSLSIQSGLNKPRYASLKGIMSAKKKPIEKFSADDLEIDIPNDKIEAKKMYVPEKSKQTKYIEGDTESIVGELIKILKEDIKAID